MLRRFLSQAWLYHKGRQAAFRLEEFLLFDSGYPLLTMIFYCLLASYSFRTSDLRHWVIGNSFLLCTRTCIFGLGGIFSQERQSGRLRSLLAAPSSILSAVLASGVFPAIIATITASLGFLIASSLFGVDFSIVPGHLLLLTMLSAMISATCFGLFLSVFSLLTGSMFLILNIISYVLMIFTGAEFPVSQLPLFGRILSHLLPLTHGIEAMKHLFVHNYSEFTELIGLEVLVGCCYAILAVFLFRAAENISRKTGKFDLF